MALPTIIKNWLVTTNQNITGDANLDSGGPSGACNSARDRRNLMLGLKNQLITGGTSNVGPGGFGAVNTWTVRYSCGGNNGGSLVAGTVGDAVDRWTIDTDIPWNTPGNAHAWIVLRNTNIGTYGVDLLIELVQSTNTYEGATMDVYVGIVDASGNGYTGGSTTARPTAQGTNNDEEVAIRQDEAWSGSNTLMARTFHWNTWQSEDGTNTYIVIFWNNICVSQWMIGVPQSPNSSWSEPRFFAGIRGLLSDFDNACFMNDWYDVSEMKTWRADRISTADSLNQTFIYLTTDTFAGGPFNQIFTVPNDISGEYPLAVIGLTSRSSNFIGRQGTMFDLYFGLESVGGPAGGATYPSGGSKTWAQFGAFVFPWDGSTPVIT